MSPLIDPTGMVNVGLVSHVQAASVQKAVQIESSTPDLQYESLQIDALKEVEKDASQLGSLSSAVALNELKDDDEKEEEKQMRQSKEREDEDEIENELEDEYPRSIDPFVGNLLNLKV